LVDDEMREATVLFGGRGRPSGVAYDNTWEWNSATWEQAPVNSPAARMWPLVAGDSLRGVLSPVGGWDDVGHQVVGDVWMLVSLALLHSPADLNAAVGQPAQFTAEFRGGGVTYRGRHDGVPLFDDGRIPGTATDTLNISRARLSDAGSFDLRATNERGNRDCAGSAA
jgi:hypothetical protein